MLVTRCPQRYTPAAWARARPASVCQRACCMLARCSLLRDFACQGKAISNEGASPYTFDNLFHRLGEVQHARTAWSLLWQQGAAVAAAAARRPRTQHSSCLSLWVGALWHGSVRVPCVASRGVVCMPPRNTQLASAPLMLSVRPCRTRFRRAALAARVGRAGGRRVVAFAHCLLIRRTAQMTSPQDPLCVVMLAGEEVAQSVAQSAARPASCRR